MKTDRDRQKMAGSMLAFSALLAQERGFGLRLASRMLRNESDAEDVVQETSRRAWEHRRQFRSTGKTTSFRNWFTRIVTHCVYDLWEARQRHGALVAAYAHEAPTMVEPTAAIERMIAESLGRLSREFCETLLLREYQGLSYQEIAAAQGVRRGTVMSRLSRARAQLAAHNE